MNHDTNRELTVRVLVVAFFITGVMTLANVYVAMKAGLTVSASIPAAVLAMAVLRLFRDSSTLEVNLVQTAASSGEALAAGMVFTVPALILLGYWYTFPYWETVLLAWVGGILGVLFSIPLRQILLSQSLPFPEGTAIGTVLRSASLNQGGMGYLAQGGLIGLGYSFLQSGLKILAEQLQVWVNVSSTVVGFGLGFNPALLGAGYIVGAKIAVNILLGILLGWIVGIPLLTHFYHNSATTNAYAIAQDMYINHLRFIGLGVLFMGALSSLKILVKPIFYGLGEGWQLLRQAELPFYPQRDDLPVSFVMLSVLAISVLLWLLIQHVMGYDAGHLASPPLMLLSIVLVFFILLVGFLLACVCGYLVGLVGSSASPLSALLIVGLVLASAIIFGFMAWQYPDYASPEHVLFGTVYAVLTAVIISGASAITNDTIQDLKAGQMIGAKPWKQQLLMLFGVSIAALLIPLILNILLKAHGLSLQGVGHHNDDGLAVPQAQLMATLAQGIFSQQLNWPDISIGMLFGLVLALVNLARSSNSINVLAVGLGCYLPMSSSSALVIGASISYFVQAYQHIPSEDPDNSRMVLAHQRGILFASGIVAGSAIMGIMMAIPNAMLHHSFTSLLHQEFHTVSALLSLLATMTLCVWMYHILCRAK